MSLRKTIWLLTLISVAFAPGIAGAHVGSPDVFFEGMIGNYPAKVIVRMPGVVPGRATIHVEIENGAPAKVYFRPLFFDAAVSNAPPAEEGFLLPGTTNAYEGDLWLMAHGGYTVEVKLAGASGTSSIQLPVNSIATQQLKMPWYLGLILVVLSASLVLGGVLIVAGAAREAVLPPGESPGASQRRRGWIAGIVTSAIFIVVLVAGNFWWRGEENNFKRTLRLGGWPQIESSIRSQQNERWLDLSIVKDKKKRGEDESGDDSLSFAPDHGKIAHLFLIREPHRDVFAHLHPVRRGKRGFSATLPPLPAGNYSLFCDFTLEKYGISCTATDTLTLPPTTSTIMAPTNLDADDSWMVGEPENSAPSPTSNSTYQFPDGSRVVWLKQGALAANSDAGLQFEVWDADGKPARLEPYMEMLSHGVVMRSDGKVFVHLHPLGNFSMASQDYFQAKLARETGDAAAALCGLPSGTNQTLRADGRNVTATIISLPYEFPSAGDYRIWVQFKIHGKVSTAVFEAKVAGKSGV